MGIRRRSLGGGLLAGLGVGLSQLAESRVKRRQLEQVQAGQAAEGQQKFGYGLVDKILAEKDPVTRDQLIGIAQANNVDLRGLTQSPDQRLAPTFAKIGGESNPTNLPPDALTAALAGNLGRDPAVLAQLQTLLEGKRGQIAAGVQTDITNAGQKANVTSYQTGLGTGQAAHENAPTAIADAVAKMTAEGPPQAQNAGLTTGAQFDAAHTPDRIRLGAQAAGANAGAVATAQQAAATGDTSGLDGLADMVLSNPDLLDKFTPTQRGAILGHIAQSGGTIATKRDAAMNAMIDQAQETITNLKTLPGMSSAVGAQGPASFFGLLGAPLPGTAAADYVRYVDTLKSQLTLPRLDVLKGLGRVTDREFKALSDAVTALDRRMSEGQFKKELATIEMNLAGVRSRTTQPNAAPPPTPGSTLDSLLPPGAR